MTAEPDVDRSVSAPQPAKAGGVFPGLYSAGNERDLIVFLIGMRVNSWRGIPAGLGAFFAMPRMLASLAKSPEKGCLGGHFGFGWGTATVVQYWRSYEDLERFAKAPDDEHLPAWRWYNRLGKRSVGAGIWHETFRVNAGASETLYVNMPKFGLAEATTHVPVRGAARTSRERIERPAGAPV